MLLYCLANLVLIISSTILRNFKIVIYIYNLINHKLNLKKLKKKNIANNKKN